MIRVDEITRVRHKPIVEIPPFRAIPIPVRHSTTTGSTIAPAQKISKPAALRPRLDPLAPHYMWGILDLYSQIEKTAQLEGKICDRETKIALDHLVEIDKQKVEMLRQHAQSMKSKKSWSSFENVIQYVSFFSSLVIGSALLGSAPVAGAFLIAAGGLGVFNRISSDLKIWEFVVSRFSASVDLQIKIASQIDTYCTYLATALSVAGTIGLYSVGALSQITYAGRDKALQKFTEIIGYTSSSLQIISRVINYKMNWTQQSIRAELKKQETLSFCTRQEIQNNTSNLRRIIEFSEKISESVKQAIASSSI